MGQKNFSHLETDIRKVLSKMPPSLPHPNKHEQKREETNRSEPRQNWQNCLYLGKLQMRKQKTKTTCHLHLELTLGRKTWIHHSRNRSQRQLLMNRHLPYPCKCHIITFHFQEKTLSELRILGKEAPVYPLLVLFYTPKYFRQNLYHAICFALRIILKMLLKALLSQELQVQ